MRLALALNLAVTLTGCASTPTAWDRFSRADTPADTRNFDWQECHDRHVSKASQVVGGPWLLTEQAKREPEIRACMEAMG